MKTLLLTLCALAGTGYAAQAAAPAAAPEIAVYDGRTLADDGLTAQNWGGGSAAESTDLFLFGGHSLKVTTLDPYQGAKITLAKPVALSGTDRVFQVTIQRGPVTLHYVPQPAAGTGPTGPQNTPGSYPGGGGYSGGGGYPGKPGGYSGGGGYPGGPPGGGYPGASPGGFGGGGYGGSGFGGRGRGRGRRGGGRGGQNTPAAPLIPLITKLRLQFTLADGRKADVYQAIPETADPVAGTGWYSVNVPLSALNFSGGEAQLKSVTVAGDQFGVFYIGRMQVAPTPAPPPVPKAAPAEDPNAPDNPSAPGNSPDGRGFGGPLQPQGFTPPGTDNGPGRREE